ncbi:MAG: group 1 glycosyl transferase [Parcubacteria group bacterium Gr01-1014_44]|nr:MAG: group 1 glycosyl transferase [Parcubacteria group bacterium Gr01-1014_44]
MAKLLMITGLGSARDLASGKKGAFYNTLEEFHKYWERIDIIAPKIKGQKQKIKELFGNVFVHISPWPLIFHPLWFLKKGLEIFRKEKFDLMTVQEFPPFYNGIGARMLWRKIKVPYVLEIHHIPGYPKAASWKEKFYRNLTGRFIKYDAAKAVAVRTVNQNQVPDFLKKAGVPAEKIKFIPSLYIDLETFRPMDPPAGGGKEYDLIFVGRLVENKGINLFLETVKKLDAKAIIVGDGPLALDIKLKIEKWKLKITFHGWAKDAAEVSRLINKSKVLMMPSYNEGGPRVVVEAMACGVPVLATPVGIVQDIIKDKESGRIINWQAEDMVAKAKELLSNAVEYEKYRQAGIEIAKNFERKEAIKNYAEQLKQISHTTHSRPSTDRSGIFE